jgi:hypothetical protein
MKRTERRFAQCSVGKKERKKYDMKHRKEGKKNVTKAGPETSERHVSTFFIKICQLALSIFVYQIW